MTIRAPPAADAAATPASGPLWRPDRCKHVPQPTYKPAADGVIGVFLVIGDWGFVPGASQCGVVGCQTGISKLAQEWLAEKKYELKFVISLGDNVYGGVPADGGAKMKEVWWSRYGDMACVPWYATLGNHDFGGGDADKCWPYLNDKNCGQMNGGVDEVRDKKDCVKSRPGTTELDCWAMPAGSYAVHAWEEELGVTLLSFGFQPFGGEGGFPFKAKKGQFNHQKSLDDSKNVIKEAMEKGTADNVVMFNHYPLHYPWNAKSTATWMEPEIKAVADAGKKVNYWGGHTHDT
eukprot:g7532.t1